MGLTFGLPWRGVDSVGSVGGVGFGERSGAGKGSGVGAAVTFGVGSGVGPAGVHSLVDQLGGIADAGKADAVAAWLQGLIPV